MTQDCCGSGNGDSLAQHGAIPNRIHISYFSDILCVWAYVSQSRLDELQRRHGAEIEVSYQFLPIFGSTEHRIGEGWKDRGGFGGYADHVGQVCSRFPDVALSPDAWRAVRPTSSAPAHQLLEALRLLEAEGEVSSRPVDAVAGRSLLEETAWRVRLAFFRDARDVSRFDELWRIADELELPITAMKEQFDNGRALAAACRDAELAVEHRIEGSPTYLLNQGRQKLYGNLGYEIIEANVEEVLRQPTEAASSC